MEDEKAARMKAYAREQRRLGMQDQMIKNTLEREKKSDSKALTHRLYSELHQAHYAKGFTKAQEALEWRRKEVKQETALAQQILADRVKEDRISYQRRLLRKNPELQELESRIKAAYIQQELYTQLEVKKSQKIKQELEAQEEFYRFKAVQDAINEREEQLRIETAKKKEEYRNCLQDQMIEKHKQKVEEYKRSLEEKAIIEDSIRVIEIAEKNEEEERLKKIQELKEDIEEFNRCREAWIVKEKEKEEEEDKKIMEYLEDKFKKEQILQDKARKVEEERLRFHEIVVKVMKQAQDRRLEEERINQILMDEDNRQKEEAKLRAEYEKKNRIKQGLREIFSMQVEEKLRQLEEERKHDYIHCELLLKEEEEKKKREKAIEDEKQLKQVRYAQELKQVVKEKEKQRQNEFYRRIDEYHSLIKENKDRLKEIDDERLRMLQEHATRLLGFLPKGAIKSSDLPYLDPAVQKYYNYSQTNTPVE